MSTNKDCCCCCWQERVLTLIHWIVIYPVDSVIQPLNNWGLVKYLQIMNLLSKKGK